MKKILIIIILAAIIGLAVYYGTMKKDDDKGGSSGGDGGKPVTPVLRDTPETMRSASSVWGGEPIGTGHGRGRLDSKQAWSAANNTVGEWYQIDNGVEGKIKGIAIKGRGDQWSQYVKTFKVKYKGNSGTWKDVEKGKIFTGNTDQNTKVDVNFANPIVARYIRIYPQTYESHMSLRADIISGKTMTNKKPTIVDVPYSGHKSSGNWGGDNIGTSHGSGRLDSAQGWSAKTSVVGDWYELNLTTPTDVSGVVIKGRADVGQYVTSLKVTYKNADGLWVPVDSGYIFEGSYAGNSQANIFFKKPVKTSAIRIYPQTWNSHMSMRAGLITGSETTEGYMIQPDEYEYELEGFSF